jgi:transcription antitermination protein NusB
MSARSASAQARHAARSAARLASVQALYQMEITGRDVAEVAAEFVTHRLETPTDGLDLGNADRVFFHDLLSGVVEHQVAVDNLIARALAKDWTLERLDSILRALLRAAVYEIALRTDVPARAAIDEYVEVARAFFEGEEPKFVNGVLDAIARQARPAEMAVKPPR